MKLKLVQMFHQIVPQTKIVCVLIFLVLFLMSCSFTMCVFVVSILANTTAVNERIKLMIAGAAG